MKKIVSLVFACALLLSGCAGPEGAQAEAVVVNYGMSNTWDSLMPYNSVSGSNYSRIVYDKLYDRLVYVHADGTLSPRAADSWESADGGRAIVFQLNEKAMFHDGTPVTAEHWAETFRLMTHPECPVLGRANFSLLAGTDENGVALSADSMGVEAVDEHTLKLTFKAVTDPVDFLNEKNRELYVLPTHLLAETAPADLMQLDLWAAPVGSGPCAFDSELAGSRLVLRANGAYHLGAPGFEQLVMTVMDKSNLLTALLAGDLDYYTFGGSISAEDAEVAEKNGLTVVEGTVPNTFYELMLNCERVESTQIRAAIDFALDKELLCEQSTRGLGTVTGSSLLPGSTYAAQSTVARPRDIAAAKALLAEGGYDGKTYTLACTANRAGLAALIQQNLADAGIRVAIETVDSATMFAGMSEGTYDMGIASHTPVGTPTWFVESRFTESNNIFHVPDVEPYAASVAAVKAETETAEKAARIGVLEQRLFDQRPFIPLWFGRALHVQSPTVSGIDYASASFSNENVWDWVKA